MKHIFSVLVEDKPGVMARVSGLFSRRGFNIDSLSVGKTNEEGVSGMTIIVDGDDTYIDQVRKQLNKLINVIKIVDIPPGDSVERELALIKVKASIEDKKNIMRLTETFRAKIVDVGTDTLTIEVTGEESKINAIIQLLSTFGIEELVRTGRIAMMRGQK
jgi:acetolactate synthase-1/3 small subunit